MAQDTPNKLHLEKLYTFVFRVGTDFIYIKLENINA